MVIKHGQSHGVVHNKIFNPQFESPNGKILFLAGVKGVSLTTNVQILLVGAKGETSINTTSFSLVFGVNFLVVSKKWLCFQNDFNEIKTECVSNMY